MADLAIDPTVIFAGPNAQLDVGVCGATVVAGQPLYKDPADGKLKLALGSGTALQATVIGLAMHASSDGQPIEFDKKDPKILGITGGSPGSAFFLSTVAGGIVITLPVSGFTTFLGIENADSSFQLEMVNGVF